MATQDEPTSMDDTTGMLLQRLQAALNDPSFNVRRQAVFALGELPTDTAIGLLITSLNDESIGRDAVFELLEMGQAAIQPLLTALAPATVAVRKLIIETLGFLKAVEIVPYLIVEVQTPASAVKEEAIVALGKIGDPQALSSLVTVLTDQDDALRAVAAIALGEIGNTEAVPALCVCLRDPWPAVRIAAANALGEIGDAEAVPDLLQLVGDTAIDPEDEHMIPVNVWAIGALGTIGDQRAVGSLLEVMAQFNVEAQATNLADDDPEDELLCFTIEALGKLGAVQAIPYLTRIVEEVPDRESYILGTAAEVAEEAISRIQKRQSQK
ncbi:MAG: HEAT repeat domain-containing protein [Chloroflexaceae bacterium]|nr:HEAT repeat domain-containing protein [Chloroflexaceae bacterium]